MVNGVSTLPLSNCPIAESSPATLGSDALAAARSTFVAGDENRLLAAVLQAWCNALDDQSITPISSRFTRLTSPLVLVGPTGSGKSHLAAGLAALAGDQGACFVTANDLRRDFAQAVQSQTAPAWRERMAAVPVLVVDDLDHLPARGSFQQELVGLVKQREQLGHKLIATSTQPIAHLPGWLPELVNWFAGGLTVEIAPLGPAAKRELIEQLATVHGWRFTDEAFAALLQQASPEPRELFQLAAELQRQFGRGASFQLDTLSHFLNKRKADHAPDVRDIVRVVARYYRLPLKTLTSASRQAAVVGARATAIYLARTLTDASYEQIGQHLGGRDHSTVLHNYRQTEKRLASEAALRSAIEDLTRLLRK